jgi:hypothetical protein
LVQPFVVRFRQCRSLFEILQLQRCEIDEDLTSQSLDVLQQQTGI